MRARPRFSGMFGPKDAPPEEEQKVEVGILVRSHWVGQLIGKKGVNIRELRQKSEANMNFGDDIIEVDQDKFNVMAISGTRDQVSRACVAIAEKLGEITQSEDWKLVFLIPNSYCGMFIGKKGANVKKIKGEAGAKVSINLSDNPIPLPGANEVTSCTIYGNKEDIKEAIEQAAITLGDISASMRAEIEPKLPSPSYGGGFGRGPGGPASYGGGFARDPDSRRGGGYSGGLPGGGSGYRGSADISGFGSGSGGGGYGKGGGGRGGGGYGRGSPSLGSSRNGWGSGGGSISRGGWGSRGGTRGGWGNLP